MLQGSVFPKIQWFRFYGVQGNIQVPIWPGFRRCASRHSAIHPKGDAISQTGANEGVQTLLKAGSKAIKEGATVKTQSRPRIKTYGRCSFRRRSRPGRLQAN